MSTIRAAGHRLPGLFASFLHSSVLLYFPSLPIFSTFLITTVIYYHVTLTLSRNPRIFPPTIPTTRFFICLEENEKAEQLIRKKMPGGRKMKNVDPWLRENTVRRRIPVTGAISMGVDRSWRGIRWKGSSGLFGGNKCRF